MVPFRYGGVVSGKDFCGRQVLLSDLNRFFKTGQNVVLVGERRIGKTSLVFEAAHQAGVPILFIDVLGVRSIDALVQQILRGVFALEEKAGGLLQKLRKSLAALRPTISPDPVTGSMTIGVSPGRQLTPESIPAVLDVVADAAARRSAVVFFDEFQDILKVEGAVEEVVAQMRSRIQFLSNVPFVFAGSIRQDMELLFTSPDSPFFKSAVPVHLGPLTFEEFAPWLTERFEQGRRKIDQDMMKDCFELCQNLPGDIQQLCEALWACTAPGDEIDSQALNRALALIYSREQKAYEQALVSLKSIHLRVLLALAHQGGEKPTSKMFMEAAGVRHSNAIMQALTRLAALRLVHKTEHGWRFDNPFFRTWLLNREGLANKG